MENTEGLWTAELNLNADTNLPHLVMKIRLPATNCFNAWPNKEGLFRPWNSTQFQLPDTLVTADIDVKRSPVENSARQESHRKTEPK